MRDCYHDANDDNVNDVVMGYAGTKEWNNGRCNRTPNNKKQIKLMNHFDETKKYP